VPLYDFVCDACKVVFDDYSTPLPEGGIAPVNCSCGALARHVWITAPGVKSDDSIPWEMAAAARTQLGRNFETRKQLEDHLQAEGLIAVTRKEFEQNMPSGDKRETPVDPHLDDRIHESLKKNMEKLAAGTLKPAEATPPPQEVLDHAKKITGIDFSKGAANAG